MKRKTAAVLCAALMMTVISGCGKTLSNDFVTVKMYKGLKVTEAKAAEVTDEDVENAIRTSMESAAEQVEITDRPAQNGDWVNIDYAGTRDGVAFDGGTAQGTDLELGSGTFIGADGDYAGFEEQIIGHKTGESFDITVKFPDTYTSEELAGQVADFHIVLNKIYERRIPELTDEWVLSNSTESKTAEEYREEVRENLEESNENTVKSTLQSEIQEALLENIEIKSYPEGKVEEQVEQLTNYYTQIAGLYGMEFADYVQNYMGMTEEDFNTRANEVAQQSISLVEAMKLIGEKEKLEPSEEEYKEEIEEYAEKAGYDDVDAYLEQADEEALKESIYLQKVMDFLIDQCVQVEADK